MNDRDIIQKNKQKKYKKKQTKKNTKKIIQFERFWLFKLKERERKNKQKRKIALIISKIL